MQGLIELGKLFIDKHLIITMLSTLVSIIILWLLKLFSLDITPFAELTYKENFAILFITFFSITFLISHLSKWLSVKITKHIAILANIKDKILNLTFEEKELLITLFQTRIIPRDSVGLTSLVAKGILNVNELIVYNSGVTIGHPVEFTPIMKIVLRKRYFKKVIAALKIQPRIHYWQKNNM